MIDRWIAEATECDFKVALEVKKPKSWLKSVSAFANGIGGTLFFGIDNDRNVVGLADAQNNAEAISRLIKERITPYGQSIDKTSISDENQLFDEQKAVVSEKNQLFETLLLGLKAKASTKETMLKLYHKFGFDAAFARADIMKLAGVTSSPAGALIDKLKSAGLIEPVAGQGKGKYRFVLPKE